MKTSICDLTGKIEAAAVPHFVEVRLGDTVKITVELMVRANAGAAWERGDIGVAAQKRIAQAVKDLYTELSGKDVPDEKPKAAK